MADSLADVMRILSQSKPTFFVLDSVNRLIEGIDINLELKENVLATIRIAQKRRMVGVIVAHVNKEGDVSGPIKIEHDVDGTILIDVDEKSELRTIRAKKLRFAATDFRSTYKLTEEGILWQSG
jgi:DNA repair protein RadA/Sms